MPSQSQLELKSLSQAPLVADNPVLDLLNTVAMVEGAEVDFLQTNTDVLRWAERLGIVYGRAPKFAPGALVKAARRLRETVRVLLAKRKAGIHAPVGALNAFLAAASSYPQMVWTPGKAPELVRLRVEQSPEQFLGPFAEAAADLLVHGDLGLVRQCEDDGCVLWFYDRTKSHRRRWCSVATCGNRNKVKAFRQRQQR